MGDKSTGGIAGKIGRGLVAGLAGTAVMTVAQILEDKYLNYGHGNAPAEGVEKVLDIEPKDQAAENMLSQLTHFGYGAGWGALRGVMHAFGMRGAGASTLHGMAVSTAAAIILPKLGLAPKIAKQPPRAVILETVNHAIYACVTGWVFDKLERQARH